MKKQRAMVRNQPIHPCALSNHYQENGTWKVNSRGRKRKLPTPEQGMSDSKNGYAEAMDDDATETDDFMDEPRDGSEVINRLPPFSEIVRAEFLPLSLTVMR